MKAKHKPLFMLFFVTLGVVCANAALVPMPDGFTSPKLPATLTVQAVNNCSRPPVLCGHAFGPGDVPVGSRVRVRTEAGVEVSCQLDGVSTWLDGSIKWGELSFVAPNDFTAEQQTTYLVDAVPGTTNQNAVIGLAGMAAISNFRVTLRGFDFGADVYEMKVNDVITNAVVGNYGGDNPVGGVDLIAAGPVREGYYVWGFAKRTSDGAMHASLRIDVYIWRWASSGAWEITAVPRQPNTFGPHPAGKVGISNWNRRLAGIVEVWDGTKRLAVWGGPEDRDARTVAPSAFNTVTGTYTMPLDQNLGWQGWTGGVPVGMSGNLPGGFNASMVYYPGRPDSSRNTKFYTARRNRDSPVPMTSAPAGNCTVFPLVATFPGMRNALMDANCDPIWLGTGPRPIVMVAHDEMYLTRATRFVLPMDLSQPRFDFPGTPRAYRPNEIMADQNWDLGMQGDDWNTDRIGWLPWSHANLVLRPFDRVRDMAVRSQGLMLGQFPWHFLDEQSGRVPVCNNGPNRNGTRYAKLGVPASNLFMHASSSLTLASPLRPKFGATDDALIDSGIVLRYNVLNDGSHLPNYAQVPYLRTGHRLYRHMMQDIVVSAWSSANPYYNRNFILAPPIVPVQRQFSTIQGQIRTYGWVWLALSNLLYVLPTSEPEHAYFVDLETDTADYWKAIIPYAPGAHLGLVNPSKAQGIVVSSAWTGNSGEGGGFQAVYRGMGAVIQLYRGDERWRPFVENYAIFHRDAHDDMLFPNGSGYIADIYFTKNGPDNDNWFRNLSEFVAANCDTYPPPTINYTGPGIQNFYYYGQPTVDPEPKGFSAAYVVQHTSLLALMEWCSVPASARVRQQLITRGIARPPGVEWPRDRWPLSRADRPEQMSLQWSILPPPIDDSISTVTQDVDITTIVVDTLMSSSSDTSVSEESFSIAYLNIPSMSFTAFLLLLSKL